MCMTYGGEQWQKQRDKQEGLDVERSVRHAGRRVCPGALDVELRAEYDALDGESPERFAA